MTEKPRKGSLNKRMYVCMYVCKSAGFGRSGKKNFFSTLRATVSSKYNGGRGRAPGSFPGSATAYPIVSRSYTTNVIRNKKSLNEF